MSIELELVKIEVPELEIPVFVETSGIVSFHKCLMIAGVLTADGKFFDHAIVWDKEYYLQTSSSMFQFVNAHEIGHIHLNHTAVDLGTGIKFTGVGKTTLEVSRRLRQEIEADAYAINITGTTPEMATEYLNTLFESIEHAKIGMYNRLLIKCEKYVRLAAILLKK